MAILSDKAPWKTQATACQGRGHEKDNLPCQDKVFSLSKNNVSVIALSDGAGSSEHSEVGATIVTTVTCNYIADNFDSMLSCDNGIQVKECFLHELLHELHEEADHNNWNVKSLHCTLLFIAIKDNHALIGHIGDGLICGFKNNMIKVISAPNNGEFINTTTFVTSHDALQDFRLYRTTLDGYSGFCLMSDGAAESLYNRKTHTIAKMVEKLIVATSILSAEEAAEYQSRLLNDFLKKATRDDCSVAVISKRLMPTALQVMDDNRLMQIYGYKNAASCRRVNALLLSLQTRSLDVNALCRIHHLKKKVVRKRLSVLLNLEIIQYNNGMYYINS